MPAISVPNNHLFPPGPCEIAVRTNPDTDVTDIQKGYEFLGTTREGGQAQEVLYTGNLFADYAGSAGMPADIHLSGKGLVVVCQMSNFNPITMLRLRSRYFDSGGSGGFTTEGKIFTNDIGALLIHEKRYISMCIRSLNAYKSDSKYYAINEAGLWVPFCFPSGAMIWDYAAREQVYSLTFIGLTYMNVDVWDPDVLIPDNSGLLYSTQGEVIAKIWDSATNPSF